MTVSWRRSPSGRGAASWQCADRDQKLTAVADSRDAEFLQIVCREMAQDLEADCVFAECCLIAFEAEISQPDCDIHSGVLRLGDA